MMLFWIAAATLTGAAALLVMLCARQATPAVENPALAVHRRQLSEIDALADRELIGQADRAAAYAEAGRRLLSSAALDETPESQGSILSRRLALGGAVLAAAVAVGLYMALGAPGLADQPYKDRVAAWRSADPSTLDAPRMAAVLKALTVQRPNDPEAWSYLGRAQMASGDAYGAQKAFSRAVGLAPEKVDYQTALGEALIAANDDKPTPEAVNALRRAVALSPHDLGARFILGRALILMGERSAGLDYWRSMVPDLRPEDPRRAGLSAEIQRIAAGGAVNPPAQPPPPPEGGADAQASAFIRGMVAKQAASLAAHPNDPTGWARLVRSYGVLHDAPAQADALAKARRQFAGQPAALAPVEAEAKAYPAVRR